MVYVPLVAELRALVNRLPKTATTILTSKRGRPWTQDGYRTMFNRAKRKAGIKGKTFYDARGTFVTRAAARGLTPQELATITGHSIKDVEPILDTYTAYLHRDRAEPRAGPFSDAEVRVGNKKCKTECKIRPPRSVTRPLSH